MNRDDVDLLVAQIRNIILNKPLTEELRSESAELADLQEAVFYLSNCLAESNEFLKSLWMGELDVKAPSRHNFLAGNLKELHSALKHLTWQANQVANGDYNQSVSFLGDFSTSFNQMIHQLAERESQLKLQSSMLTETVDLMKSVMDGLKDWIVVTSKENGEIIYANRSAKQFFYDTEADKPICNCCCELFEYVKNYKHGDDSYIYEHKCDTRKTILRVRTYSIQWNEKLAYAHYIADVTREKEYQEQIEGLAYTDELTGLYNRRFCLENLDKLTDKKSEFSFCMIDLDGLKYANDNFGHAAGDRYLKLVAQEMTRITRSTDMICRIGGDEFAILFPNCNEQIVRTKMEQLDQTIIGLSKEFSMSVSYGVLYIEEGTLISSEAIMEQADEKMYLLKNIKKAIKSNQGGLTMAFTWSKELETGNAQIDTEHKELIQAINNLLAACSTGKGRSEISHTMDFLDQYTKTHFGHEQALQMQSGYPDYANHKKYHEWFIKVVEDISARLKAEGPSIQLVGEINKQLGGWLINHIKTEDVKVAKHVLSQKK